MDRELIRDYLEKSGMHDAQADALSRIFAEVATKSDLALLEQKFEARLLALEMKIETLKSDLTWRMVALFAFLGTIMTLVDLFVD